METLVYVCVCICAQLPFIDVVSLEYIDSINVRDVEDGLVAGRIWQLHQNFIQQHRLQEIKHDTLSNVISKVTNHKEEAYFISMLYVCVCVCLTGLYILSCALVLLLNSLSGPDEVNCLAA